MNECVLPVDSIPPPSPPHSLTHSLTQTQNPGMKKSAASNPCAALIRILGGSSPVSMSSAMCFVQHSGFMSMVWGEGGREGRRGPSYFMSVVWREEGGREGGRKEGRGPPLDGEKEGKRREKRYLVCPHALVLTYTYLQHTHRPPQATSKQTTRTLLPLPHLQPRRHKPRN